MEELTFAGEDEFSYRVIDYLGRKKVHTIKLRLAPSRRDKRPVPVFNV
jgi:hypothetical protein